MSTIIPFSPMFGGYAGRIQSEVFGFSFALPILTVLGNTVQHDKRAFTAVIIAPVMEGIIFRLIFLESIKSVQYLFSLSKKINRFRILGSEQSKRVWIQAIIYGVMQHSRDSGALTNAYTVINSTYYGVLWGYAKESTGMTGMTIISHAIHNFCVFEGRLASHVLGTLNLGILTYCYGPKQFQNKVSWLARKVHSCIGQVFNWCKGFG